MRTIINSSPLLNFLTVYILYHLFFVFIAALIQPSVEQNADDAGRLMRYFTTYTYTIPTGDYFNNKY